MVALAARSSGRSTEISFQTKITTLMLTNLREREIHTKATLLASSIVLLGLPVNAAEKVTGVNKDPQRLSELTATIPDKPGHTFMQLR